MTSPQDPWQQPGYPPYPQGGFPPPGTPVGGTQQHGGFTPYPQQPSNQQQGYQQQGQPNPYAAPPVSPYEGVPARPKTIEIAFWIAEVVPVLVTVMMVLSFLGAWSLISRLPTEDQAVQGTFGKAAMTGLILVTIFFVALTAVWVALGFQLRAGRNFARVILTVLAALWALSAVSGLVNGGFMINVAQEKLPVVSAVLSYAQDAVGLAAMVAFVVLVFVTPSNRYFQQANRR